MLHLVKQDISEFVAEAPQFDDMTMVGLRIIKKGEGAKK